MKRETWAFPPSKMWSPLESSGFFFFLMFFYFIFERENLGGAERKRDKESQVGSMMLAPFEGELKLMRS